MIIFVINLIGITGHELKGDAPIAGHGNGPRAFSLPCQLVQVPAWHIKLFDLTGSIDSIKSNFDLLRLSCWNPFRVARLEEQLEPFMLPAFDHSMTVTKSVTIVKCADSGLTLLFTGGERNHSCSGVADLFENMLSSRPVQQLVRRRVIHLYYN